MTEYVTTLLLLFWEFFKTGLFAVGGGLATLPFVYDIAERYTWLDAARIPDMVAIAESTPGPIGINVSTFAGYSAAGIAGGFVATFGVVLPSLIVIIIVAKFLERFKDSKLVRAAFGGMRPSVAALIATAGMTLIRAGLLIPGTWHPDLKALALFVVLMVATNIKKINFHPVVYIALSAAAGIIFKM